MDMTTIIIIGVLLLVFAGVLLIGLSVAGQWIMENIWLMFMAVVFAIVLIGLWYFIFRKKPVSVNSLVEKDMFDSCSAGKDEHLGNLYVSGSSKGNGKFIGAIKGKVSLPFKSSLGGDYVVKEKDGIKSYELKGGKEIAGTQHIVSLQKPGFLNGLFAKRFLLRIFDIEGYPLCHDAWIGDVNVYADSLYKIGRYYFLSNQVNSGLIEPIVSLDNLRLTVNLAQDHMHDIMIRSLNANPDLEAQVRKEKKLPFSLLPQSNQPRVAEPIQ